MQRISWDLLRQKWVDLYFFEPVSNFISRLHEDRGTETVAVVIFSPDGEEVPPPSPPVSILVLYSNRVDFLKDNLFLRERDQSGMLNFFSYGIDSFANMIKDSNPLAINALRTGRILYETGDRMEEFVT